MEEIFRNETDISGIRFKKMMLCRKFYNNKIEYVIKFIMCLSILVLIWFVDCTLGDKIFCLFWVALGLADILKLDLKRIKTVEKLEYSFLRGKFKVFNGEYNLVLNYTDIQEIIKTKRYYFLTAKDYMFAIDTKGFTVGNSNELIEFILKEVKKEI